VKPANDHRLSDHLSWGLLAKVFPPELVDQAVLDSDRVQQRKRLLPARIVVYYVMGLALFSRSSYEEVMQMLVEGQSWSSGVSERWPVPTKAALYKARSRLGPEPLERLFQQVAKPMATRDEAGAFYRHWRLMSIDTAELDVPDTPANADAFGRPSTPEAPGLPLPQIRVVGLSATGTRAIVDARLGRVDDDAQALALGILADLPSEVLLLAGREFFSYASWSAASSSGADLLWRVWPDESLPIHQRHDDGSYASWIHPEWPVGAVGRTGRGTGIAVRVLEYARPGDPALGTTPYRLATTITDPALAPAADLGDLYAQRWEIASAFDELRHHHSTGPIVMRSKVPDGVRQEVYGYLCVHYAIRWLMHGVQGFSIEQDPTSAAEA
jgi:hypothetical protein